MRLTTTSYAILGLLTVKEWTTYELAQQMEKSIGTYWPRAKSKIYEEPKKLVSQNLARARREKAGARARTVYSVTPKGRRAFQTWLQEPGAPPQLEFEALIKVFFAEQGMKEDLLATLERVDAWVQMRRRLGAEIARYLLSDRAEFPQRLHIIALTSRWQLEFTRAVEHWARWARDEVERWKTMDDPSVADTRHLEAQAKAVLGGEHGDGRESSERVGKASLDQHNPKKGS
ncbi:MAG: PadR family transcriptional regulator [Chloroflexi bacterium]|nr:PadR family transcriptional regulator [Chloroflexota bacterium]